MNKIIVILFICTSFLFSTEFYLNPYFESKLQKDTRSYHIINNYIDFLNKISALDKKTQIKQVNRYFNAIVSSYDAHNYNNEEYWASPFEFLSRGSGDCEDYVIAKKYTLNLIGFSKHNMYFGMVQDRYMGSNHMILALHVKKKNKFLVLDNLSTKILSLEQRSDLKPLYLFNENDYYKFDDKLNLIIIDKLNIDAYNDLKRRDKIPLVLIK